MRTLKKSQSQNIRTRVNKKTQRFTDVYQQQPTITIPLQAVFKQQALKPSTNTFNQTQQQQINKLQVNENQRIQQDLRIQCLKSARIIRPQSSQRILNPNEYYEKFKTHQLPLKKLVKERIQLSVQYNASGRFLDAYKLLDPLYRKLILDGTTFKKYVFEFYRHFTLTLIYLACDSQSNKTLNKADMYIDYFLRLFVIMDYNQYKNQIKIYKRIKKQNMIFKKLKLMSLRVRALIQLGRNYHSNKIVQHIQGAQQVFDQIFYNYQENKKSKKLQSNVQISIQKECEFILMKTTVLIDLVLQILISQGEQAFVRAQQLLEQCLKSINDFEFKIQQTLQQNYQQILILQGDCDRLDLNNIYGNLLLGYIHEQLNNTDAYIQYYKQCFSKSQNVLPENNLIRILIDRLFENGTYSLSAKLSIDLQDKDKVNEALQMLLIELMKKKIVFDLFGKDFNKFSSKDELSFQKKELESYLQQPPTMRLMSGIANNLQKSKSSAQLSFRPKTGMTQKFENLDINSQQSEFQENNILSSNQSLSVNKVNTIASTTPRSQTQKPQVNIEDIANYEMSGKVNYVRNNLAKIIQINEEKKVMLEDDFFKQTQGNQESISNAISKSVENFFKQSIMKQLKLQSTQKATDHLNNNNNNKKQVGVVIADQETSGKTFWKRFRVQQKQFEKQIFLHEKIDDFKKFFYAKQKVQNGDLNRKVLSQPEDYEALKFAKLQKSNQKKGSQQNSPGLNSKYDRFDQGTITSNLITGNTLGRKQEQAPTKMGSRRGSVSHINVQDDNFDSAMQKFKKQQNRVNVQEQTKQFLQTFKNYDAIGKIIRFNQHKEVFREAFQGNLLE